MNQDTIDKMKHMKLYGMTRAFMTTFAAGKEESFTPDELLGLLVDAEWDDRYNRKLHRSILSATFRYKASVEQISFDQHRLGHKNQILRLADGDFIKNKENLLIIGSTGIGKSFIASALGHQICSLGYRVLYQQCSKLFAKLKMAKADGTYLKELARIERFDLLILDDFGLQPLEAQNRNALMEIIEDRHGQKSTIFTSQVPVSKWHEIIGEKTIADAILDRIVHDAHRLELKGESLRKKGTKLQEGTEN
jgi:DNA replication protein DnaC